jgi:hypothetical protein
MAGRIVSATHWETADGIQLPYVVDDRGIPRVLAVLRPRPNFGSLPRWRDHQPVIPRSDWGAVDWAAAFPVAVRDQGQHGSCVGHGSVSAFDRAWIMAGHAPKQFSSCYIYGKINGGRDQGAIVSDAADLLVKVGTCLESTVPEGQVYERTFPPGADVEAARFRAADAYHVGTPDEVGSAILCGYDVVHGIWVGDYYSQLDAGGVPPVGGNGGHCQESCGLVRIAAGRYAGQWGFKTQNSWSTQWGDDGFCVLTDDHLTWNQQAFGGLDAFAIRAVADDPTDPANPPIAIA